MSGSSSPSLPVVGKTIIRKARKSPPGAEVAVQPGDAVQATDVVARADVPGHVHSVAAAQILGVAKTKVADSLLVAVGDAVNKGQVMGRARALFGLFKSEVVSPVSGVLETISSVSGHVMIREAPKPVEVTAYVNGRVTAVDEAAGVTVETEGALVQGAFGVGGEVVAPLCEATDSELSGKAVCVYEPLMLDELNRLLSAGAVAVVAPSMDGEALFSFCGDDVNLAATGDEQVGLTLLLTEGFGRLPMARQTRQILAACVGHQVSLCGVTQVRAGVIRPELIGPPVDGMTPAATNLDVGRIVKLTRGEHLGEEAEIVSIPNKPQTLESGVTVLCYEVKLPSTGETAMVPRPNVE